MPPTEVELVSLNRGGYEKHDAKSLNGRSIPKAGIVLRSPDWQWSSLARRL
jgi:hypothetical protein